MTRLPASVPNWWCCACKEDCCEAQGDGDTLMVNIHAYGTMQSALTPDSSRSGYKKGSPVGPTVTFHGLRRSVESDSFKPTPHGADMESVSMTGTTTLKQEDEQTTADLFDMIEQSSFQTAIPTRQFQITLGRQEGRFGLSVGIYEDDPDSMKIMQIHPIGPLAVWNMEHPDKRVEEGFRVLMVNSEETLDGMVMAFQHDDILDILVGDPASQPSEKATRG
mmetsp:Transcript_46412/g.110574  ORF Transcript_46412/g.110574 Transcript_46412/m.110574 type:complete len:221 (-) Transcript_46412:102-764(-)